MNIFLFLHKNIYFGYSLEVPHCKKKQKTSYLQLILSYKSQPNLPFNYFSFSLYLCLSLSYSFNFIKNRLPLVINLLFLHLKKKYILES